MSYDLGEFARWQKERRKKELLQKFAEQLYRKAESKRLRG